MHHRGEETDLGTSRSLTRLPLVPRNTVGRGRTEPRIIAFRSLLYVMCYLLLGILGSGGTFTIFVIFAICSFCYYYYLLFVMWHLVFVMCSLVSAFCH